MAEGADAKEDIPSRSEALALDMALSKARRSRRAGAASAEEAFLAAEGRKLELEMHHLRLGHFDRQLTVALKLLTAALGLVIAVALAAAVWDAVHADSVVVDAFRAPPGMAADGLDGTVVAARVLDELQRLQGVSRASIVKRGIKDAWSSDIKLDVPETGVSVGEIVRYLHAWLGHETHISGELTKDPQGLSLTVRGEGVAARTFTGLDLKALTTQAAEYVYGQAEPYAFGTYLTDVGRDAEALGFARAAMPTVKASERPYLLNVWGNALADLGRYREASAKHLEAVRVKPDYWTAWANTVNDRWILQDEEGAWRASIQFERLSHRREARSKINPSLYENGDILRQDYSALEAEVLKDAEQNNGGGTGAAQAAPVLASAAAMLHDPNQAELFLQTTQEADKDPFAIAMTHFVHGWAALDRGDAGDGAAEMEPFAAAFANPVVATQYPGTNCWLAPAEEMAGHPDKADAAITAGGRYVDCFRFRADILDHRGDWPGAQRAYAAAVAIAPDLPAAYYSWGLALARHGDLKGAMAQFAAANQRGPHWADPLKAWGDLLAAQRRYVDAEAKYAVAARYAPNWIALHLAWGKALQAEGKYAAAIAQYHAVSEAAGHG